MLALSIAVTLLVQRGISSAAEARFNSIGQSTGQRLLQRMQAYEQILRGGVALFSTSDQLSRQQWHDYVKTLDVDTNFPGIQGIGFTEYFPAGSLESHQRRIRAEGFPAYQVRPIAPRDQYTAIVWLEPFNARNQRAFGYDMFSEPIRYQAMTQARDTGKATLSGRVRLVQETGNDVQPGVLLYQPLYRPDSDLSTVAARREALLGYVYAPFRINNLMNGILGAFEDGVELELHDGADLLFSRVPSTALSAAHAGPSSAARHTPLFQSRLGITLYGRHWSLVTRSSAAFESRALMYLPKLVMVAGVLISLLFSGLVWSLATRRQDALALAGAMTSTLREREEFINAVVDNAADGILTIGTDATILSINQAAERIFGWQVSEVSGRSLNLLLVMDHLGVTPGDGVERLIGAGQVLDGVRSDGQRFPLELALSKIRVGQRTAFAAIVRDISDRLQAEEELRRSEERFHLAFQASNDGLWDWNIAENRIYYSPSWCTMLGYEPDEVPQTLEFWQQHVIHPDDYPRVSEAIAAYHRGETAAFRNEQRLRRKDGTYMWILSRAFAQRDAQGRVFRMVGINTDIDQGKQVEQMKNHFISIISHELRTPVTSIYGSIMLLQKKAEGRTETERTLLDMAQRNSSNLLTLINDLLDMDKIQSGRLELQATPLELWPMLQEAVACNQGYAEQYEVAFRLHPATEMLWVMADPTRLQQVMSNLLSNAAKFSAAHGAVDISLQRDGDHACIAVADQGVGIPNSFRGRIFSKFSQADSSSTRHFSGSGLGLHISRSIVEAMGGSISFDSEEGSGTTFYVHLPLIEAGAPA